MHYLRYIIYLSSESVKIDHIEADSVTVVYVHCTANDTNFKLNLMSAIGPTLDFLVVTSVTRRE